MSKKFAFPLAITGTESELRALVPELEKLGYRYNDATCWLNYPVLCTDKEGFCCRTYDKSPWIEDLKAVRVHASNLALCLALAAACSNDTWQEGEWCIREFDGDWQYVTALSEQLVTEYSGIYRRPTLQEYIGHFTPAQQPAIEPELPPVWYIKTTAENVVMVNNWHFAKWMNGSNVVGLYFMSTGFILETVPQVPEITTEQFRKWVLLEPAAPNSQTTPLIAPPYVTPAPNGLIPFDVELAKLGEYDVVCRNGDVPTEVTYFSNGCVVGFTPCSYTPVHPTVWKSDGTCYGVHKDGDLFLKPKVKTTYHLYFSAIGTLENAIKMGESRGHTTGIVAISTDGTCSTVHEFKKS